MIIKMREMMKHRDDQKGFTLVELIIVMAILGILAAIAVPKYSGIKASAAVKADAATAASIVQAARIQENDTGTAPAAIGDINTDYMDVTNPQSNPSGNFTLSKPTTGDNVGLYVVKWTPDSAHSPYNKEQTVIEGKTFSIAK